MPTTTVEKTKKSETGKDEKSELLLDSLEIKGYRCFEHLTIEKLGRVNLIVGKNNVGKTALLEALWIYANHDEPGILHKIVFDRNEITNEKILSTESIREYNFAVRNLFSNRPAAPPRNHNRRDSLYFIVSEAGVISDYFIEEVLNPPSNDEIQSRLEEAFINAAGSKTTFVRYFYDSQFGMPQASYLPRIDRNIKNLFINATGLANEKLVEFWDIITLTPAEDDVIDALNLLPHKKLNRINFIGYPKGATNRVPVVQVDNGKEPLPLKSFGEGMTRLLGISLALVQCQNGMLLVDEIESGLHYSVLLDVWRLIFKTARDLDVQVFATTHSSDCVKAFQRAADEDKDDKGMLIRLARKGDKIKAILFNEEELETVVENDIEVR